MMRRLPKIKAMFRTSIVVGCSLLFALQPLLVAENREKAYEDAGKRANEITDIFSSGPLQIHARVRVNAATGPIDGTYRYTQLSKDDVRVDVQIPGYTESIITRNGEQYFTRSRDLQPLPISYLYALVKNDHSILWKDHVSKVITSLQNGRTVRCYVATWHDGRGETCFDIESGVLTSSERRFNTYVDMTEFSEFRREDNKLFPAMMRFHSGKLLVEVQVDSIDHSSVESKFFDPPSNATKQERRKVFRSAEAVYSPDYWQHVPYSYKSGAVIIAGRLDEHGKILISEIQESSGPKIDAAAMRALNEVYVHPATCDGKTIPSFFRFQLGFSSGSHSVRFYSLR
jgi:hypothetical protein